jgi:hypothetical protein
MSDELKYVAVHLLHQSEPIERTDVLNTYSKDGLFCVMQDDGRVEKYPLQHIFRVTEL